MYGSGEDGAQGNPQEGGGPVHHAHYRSENGAEAGYVQKLDEEDFPIGEGHEVHSVRLCMDGGYMTRVLSGYAAHRQAVGEVAGYQDCQCDDEGNHKSGIRLK